MTTEPPPWGEPVSVWERVLCPDPMGLTPEDARFFLKLAFPKDVLDRLDELGAKARAGTLTPPEAAELDDAIRAGCDLSRLQSFARMALRPVAANG